MKKWSIPTVAVLVAIAYFVWWGAVGIEMGSEATPIQVTATEPLPAPVEPDPVPEPAPEPLPDPEPAPARLTHESITLQQLGELIDEWIPDFECVAITIDDLATQEERDRFWGWHEIRIVNGMYAYCLRWTDAIGDNRPEIDAYLESLTKLGYLSRRACNDIPQELPDNMNKVIYGKLMHLDVFIEGMEISSSPWPGTHWLSPKRGERTGLSCAIKPISDATIRKYGGSVEIYGGQIK